MTFPTGTRKSNRSAFTLIELIVVMTMMIIMAGLVFPSLKGFFRARNTDNEARRFLSLTRFGRSRAITEGLPMDLWMNPRTGGYGLQALAGYSESKASPVEYRCDDTVTLSFSPPNTVLTHSNAWTPTLTQSPAGQVKIRFQPDGFISDNSPQNIFFEGSGSQLWLAENSSRTGYELQKGLYNAAHR